MCILFMFKNSCTWHVLYYFVALKDRYLFYYTKGDSIWLKNIKFSGKTDASLFYIKKKKSFYLFLWKININIIFYLYIFQITGLPLFYSFYKKNGELKYSRSFLSSCNFYIQTLNLFFVCVILKYVCFWAFAK